MKKKTFLIVILALSLALPEINLNAQTDNEFTPYGKPLVLVFSNVNASFNKNGNSKAFEITRAYLGYEYFFSKNISSRVNLDVGDPGVGKLQMTAYLKMPIFNIK